MRRLALLLVLLCGPAWGAEPAWHPPAYPVPAGAIRLEARGVRPDTGQDVAAALNAVLAGLAPGQALLLQPGTYRVGAPVMVPSGVTVQGPQDREGHPLATLEQTHIFGKVGPHYLGTLMNAHWQADAVQDRAIRIVALRFRHETVGVMFRHVEDVAIEGCDLEGGMDGTAILGGRRTRIAHSRARFTRNAGFDHWNGTEDAAVTDSIAIAAKGHGILFNAVDTRYEPRTSRNFAAARNAIRGVGADSVGIWVSPLGRGGGHIAGTIVLEDNDIAEPQPGARTAGILVRAGDADLVAIRRNRVSGARGYPAIAVGPNQAAEGGAEKLPARVVVEGNELRGNQVSRSGGVLRAWGADVVVRGNRQEGNGFEGGGAAPALTLCKASRPAQEPVAEACR